MQRKLAAILAADVVGYSRLMQEDETGTHEAFRSYRNELLDPLMAEHHGRVVRLMGDGMLVDFTSAINAVECAIKVQRQTGERNKRMPEHRQITVRIGINVGDVFVDADEIHGEDVNIASGLEAVAEPGSIYISGPVYDQVGRKVDAVFDDLGERQVSNISQPIHIYRVTIKASGSAKPNYLRPVKQDLLSSIPSIAVLPFENRSSDESHRVFCDGFTEDIIIELSRFRSLSVVARASSFAYRGRPVELRKIGEELGVQYVLEGAIRRLGSRARITARLIDCKSGKEIWGDRYDCEAEQVFEIQDQVIGQIVGMLEHRVTQERLDQAKRVPPRDLRAYDYWLRGKKLTELWTAESDNASVDLFERAIALDPSFARAYASLASVYNSRNLLLPGNPNNASDLSCGFEYAQRAVHLDPGDARNHVDIGWSYMLARDFSNGERHFDLAGQLNPNDANICIARALAEAYLGNAEKGIELAQRAVQINPFHPDNYLGNLATIFFLSGRYRDTVATIELAPNVWPEISAWYAAACAQLDRTDQARDAARKFVDDVRALWAGAGDATEADYVRWLLHVNSIKHRADMARLLDGLEKAGLPHVDPLS